MSIEINGEKCAACGACGVVCPGSLISADSLGKAVIKRPENCWGCASCVKECGAGAIRLFLGEDMGGLGGRLSVLKEGFFTLWTIEKPNGQKETITVDGRESNHY
ncbi:ferredoxin [Clostridia bacterium]|nr:ferredoxin [Clostridia bacterium]